MRAALNIEVGKVFALLVDSMPSAVTYTNDGSTKIDAKV